MKHLLPHAIFLASLLLSGCVDRWSATGEGGVPFEQVAPMCRAQAEASARDQLPFFYSRDYGPAGLPDTRADIAARETALCLKQHGFTLSREWR